MKLHALRYFAVLAEELHYGRAASRLAITQPPLSNAIKALEQDIGVPLLIRDTRHVELTQAGAAFLEEARQILARVDKAAQVARVVGRGKRGRLEIGVTGSLIYREVSTLVRRFGREMPEVDLQLREMSSADQVIELQRGQLHAGFVNGSEPPPPLEALPLPVDRFVACLPANHPEATRRKLDLRQVAHERFVMFSREVAPANYDNVIAVFSRAGIHPQTAHAARQWLTVIAMVANGLGISLVPGSLARSRVDGVCFVPIAGQDVDSPAMLAWNRDYCPPLLASFLDCARQMLGDRAAALTVGPERRDRTPSARSAAGGNRARGSSAR